MKIAGVLLAGFVSALFAFIAFGVASDAHFQVRQYEANVAYYTLCQETDPYCIAHLPQAQGDLDASQAIVSVAETISVVLGIAAIVLVLASAVLFVVTELQRRGRLSLRKTSQ